MEVDVKGNAVVATIAIADAIATPRKRTAVVGTDAERERESLRGVCG
jgi:hypothetical protein